MKLNPTGSDLVYSTYVAGYGTANIQLFGITADQAGNAYAFGQGGGVGFPTVNPIQRLPNGGEDVLLVRLNPDGSALTFSTFLGGSGDEFGTGATVGSNGVVYVTGVTSSVDFPTTGNSVQRTLTGSTDAFVFAIDPNSGGHSGK